MPDIPRQGAALLCQLLDISHPDSADLANLAAERRQLLLANILRQLILPGQSSERVLICIEDLQWADASFSKLLGALVDEGPGAGCMLLITTRPGNRPEWSTRAHVAQLMLNELTPADSRLLIDSLHGQVRPSEEAVRQVIEQANGNPLFIEEMTRALMSIAPGSVDLKAPPTLRQALSARLDALGGARDTLLAASVIGREFSRELLLGTLEKHEDVALDQQLSRLVEAGILFQRGQLPAVNYTFKHGLIQNEAYRLTSFEERRKLHAMIARQLTGEPASQSMIRAPELIAHHLSAAEDFVEAVPLWLEACRSAQKQSAEIECIQFGERGLQDLAKMPASDERDALELALLVSMGPAQMAVLGYSAAEVSQTYERAQQLCESSEESLDQVPALFGLWTHYVVKGSTLDSAADIAYKLLALTEHRDEDLLLEARVMLGVTLTHLALYDRAIEHLTDALQQYDTEKHGHHCYLYGQEPGMAASIYRGLARAQQGDLEAAQQDFMQGLALGEASAHSHAFALCISARTLFAAGDLETASVLIVQAKQVASDHGFATWMSYADFLQAAIAFAHGGGTSQIEEMLEALERGDREGNTIATLDFSTMCTAAMLQAAQWSDALELNSRARMELDRRGFCSDAEGIISVTEQIVERAELDDSQRTELTQWISNWRAIIDEQSRSIENG